MEIVRIPTISRLLLRICDQIVTLRCLEEANLLACVSGIRFSLRSNVYLFYAHYGPARLCEIAYHLCEVEPVCRDLVWLEQVPIKCCLEDIQASCQCALRTDFDTGEEG